MINSNPFSFAKASDYSDEEINKLWIDISENFVEAVIEPTLRKSKFILGGKGTGKTHLLRHYSYNATKLRNSNLTGLDIINRHQSLGVFLRANALDASRFISLNDIDISKWQQLFGVHLELKLAEDLLSILIDIEKTTPDVKFNNHDFIKLLSTYVLNENEFSNLIDLIAVKNWIHQQLKIIDNAINAYAFTRSLDIIPPFSLGTFSIKIKSAIDIWHPSFKNIPLLYLIDEIENFYTESQQEVINTLIRYSSGSVTFRISGRLYALKTYSTIGNGEENREDVEFKKTYLDDILQEVSNYKDFAYSFIKERLVYEKIIDSNNFNLSNCFETVNKNNHYEKFIDYLNFNNEKDLKFINSFIETLKEIPNIIEPNDVEELLNILTNDFSIILKKHNILRFSKEYKSDEFYLVTANKIRNDCTLFIKDPRDPNIKSYRDSYSSWRKDLIAQLNKESSKPMIYAGLDTFIEMSSGNPRNLLSILGASYDLARFKNIDFINGKPLSIEDQSKAVLDSARFIFEQDSNFGRPSDLARDAVKNICKLLRVARFALNIPEVSPLLISFSDEELTKQSKETLQSALNYSFIFEIKNGRPNRNNLKINRKFSLNPMISPIYGLPISKRGDIGLPPNVVNAIFDFNRVKEFEALLKNYTTKWNQPFTRDESSLAHSDLFNF